MWLGSVCLGGCFVTSPVEFTVPEGVAPSIESAANAEHPESELIDLSRLATGGDAGLGPRRLTLELDVRDPDVDETLFYKVFVNFTEVNPVGAVLERTIPPDGLGDTDRRVRRVSFDVPLATLSQRCNRVEVLVSGLFEFGRRTPVREGDLGTAVFWAVEDGSVTAAECPLRP